jgi:hypothetical protein
MADIHFGILACSSGAGRARHWLIAKKQQQHAEDDLDGPGNRRRTLGVPRNDRREQAEQDNGNDDAGQPSDQEPHAGALGARGQQHQDCGDDRYWADGDADGQRQNLAHHLVHEISPLTDHRF